MKPLQIILLLIVCIKAAVCQENAGTNVVPALQQCYNTTKLVTRDYRLPVDISVFIEIIRRIEEGNSYEDARELSYQILHRFRQDGIRRTTKDVDSSQGLPYSPKGKESYKNRVQLKKLTPGNAVNFNNDSLTPLQTCSLHFMISSTIDLHEAVDDSACSRVAHYTSRLNKRNTEFSELDSDSQPKSRCPIESGVIYTKWGSVKGGLIMAGIAAGFEPNPIRTNKGTILSSYASTIAGELSEVALYESTSSKVVGNKGAWNSTVDPKYYFLENADKTNLYLTDAEIRGGLDGLFLALNIENWKSKFGDVRISQILDLYYGRGVFSDTARACNRKRIAANLSDSTLSEQVSLFNTLLDGEAQYDYTPIKENFPEMAKTAVDIFRSYIDSNLKDLECSAENDIIERVSTDILIFVDTAWNYQTIQPIISYILKNIDVNKYESSYTMFDGQNCDIIVNKTKSILDFYENYNITQHQKYATGFNYNKVINVAESAFKAKLNNATDLTGQSTIVLMLPHNTPQTSDNELVKSKRETFKRFLPDLRIIVAGSGTKQSYSNLVANSNNDVFTIPDNTIDDSTVKSTATTIIDRLRKLPRSVVNPNCGSSFSSGSNSFEVVQYVEPTAVNYHKISPNYFYNGANLKIKGQGGGDLVVCISRTDANPRANITGADCKDIKNSDEFSRDISSYCADTELVDCNPIYVSVEGTQSQVRCTEKACRFPDNIKYSINLEDVECSNSATLFINNLIILCLLFTVTLLNV